MNKIQVKRGLETNRTGYTPDTGEFLWTTDAKELWVGDSVTAGGIKVTANVEADYIPTSDINIANGVAGLDGTGLIPNSLLPAIAITSTSSVADEDAQLALTNQEEGDVAIRSDESKSYIHNGGTAGTMADWTLLATPSDVVLSVNGETGAITLSTDDIDEGSTNLYYTAARAQSDVIDDASSVSTTTSYSANKIESLISGVTIAELSDIGDVSSTTPNTDDVLAWNGSSWTPSVNPAGVTTFIGLSDTPSDYTDAATKKLVVNSAGDGVEFIPDDIDGGTF